MFCCLTHTESLEPDANAVLKTDLGHISIVPYQRLHIQAYTLVPTVMHKAACQLAVTLSCSLINIMLCVSSTQEAPVRDGVPDGVVELVVPLADEREQRRLRLVVERRVAAQEDEQDDAGGPQVHRGRVPHVVAALHGVTRVEWRKASSLGFAMGLDLGFRFRFG